MMQIYFNVPSTGVCCLCWTGIPITQPNWLVKLNATYAGVSTRWDTALAHSHWPFSQRDVYPFTNVQSTLWNFDSQGAHVYYQGYKHKCKYSARASWVQSHWPRTYSVPVAERGWGTDMQWVDIVVQKPDSHVFDLPSSCQGACDASKCAVNIVASYSLELTLRCSSLPLRQFGTSHSSSISARVLAQQALDVAS